MSPHICRWYNPRCVAIKTLDWLGQFILQIAYFIDEGEWP